MDIQINNKTFGVVNILMTFIVISMVSSISGVESGIRGGVLQFLRNYIDSTNVQGSLTMMRYNRIKEDKKKLTNSTQFNKVTK